MTLALLLTAATGAMAITDPNAVYWTNEIWAGWAENVTTHTVGDITITCSGNAKAYESTTSGEPLAMEAGNNDAITFTSNGKPFASVAIMTGYELNVAGWTYNSSERTLEWSGTPATSVTLSGCDIKADVIKFTFGTAEAPITVEPGEAANTWTFTQPGSDVVLTPIYAAATIYGSDGQTEKQAYETLKEAFANVQDGDVIKLDWDVKLTEMVTTPSTASGISFTLDFNGHTIDGSAGTNYINIDNGCELTLTDNTATQMGGLKCYNPIAGSNGGKVIFQGGRYSFNGCSSQEIALEWDGLVSTHGWVMGDGKEFVDLNNGNLDDDGFPVRVDWKAIELTIGAGRFATFYSDQNITLADGTDANIGLYTINGEGINLANNTVTVTKVNDAIAIAGMPLLVYNGTTEQKTVTLRVTPVAPTAGQMWSTYFKGTAVDKTFDADDMAKADYYVLSGGKAFAPVRGTGTIGKNKCWLQFDHETNGSAPARQLTIVFDNDETTGIEAIDNGQLTIDNYYDLNGRKLNAKPTRKGVYIKNGRKVVK